MDGGRQPASPAEVKLAKTTLAAIPVARGHRASRPRQKPLRVIADKFADDSDQFRKRLQRRGIELICPPKGIALDRQHKAVELCGATEGDGSWSVPTPGSETSVA